MIWFYVFSYFSFSSQSLAYEIPELHHPKHWGNYKTGQIEEIVTLPLLSGKVKRMPWSADEWPRITCGPAKRYNDENFPKQQSHLDNVWGKAKGHLMDHSSSPIDKLSPIEKYELLIGDKDRTLTKHFVEVGREHFGSYDSDLNIRKYFWEGYCDGAAAASVQEMCPENPIQVIAADQKTIITFYPADIEALLAVWWAKLKLDKFMLLGYNCHHSECPTVIEGRPTYRACLGLNAGAWFLAVVNQIGHAGKSFVMSLNTGEPIYNRPAYSYKIEFFNPKTGVKTTQLDPAREKLSNYPEDPYSKFRSQMANEIVGVAMEFQYVETVPAAQPLRENHLVTLNYRFDIELDIKGEVVGGEWREEKYYAHPSFAWLPEIESQSYIDQRFESNPKLASLEWKHGSPLPEEWAIFARNESIYHQLIGRIVHRLLDFSRAEITY